MLKNYIIGKIIEGYEVEYGFTITKYKTNVWWQIYKFMHRRELEEFAMNRPFDRAPIDMGWHKHNVKKERS